ncbi:uncharacterized protein AFUA_3G12440 [Aspergillus fumigatus Af293]|jgi:hypothetical protein|uniref:Uncharacterized protein n=2 Tax=Aspergillus fumigatus TaxID=746128 RepID=Q4WYB4_ASPFU|nr:hypothetical protein AFUA_3G12440 [Aspergillus fumigatus Af293]EAL92339.1 hypothetical protein AFUA_3G12440 [Aspergillus fumigatus Af293]EDP52507.1 hypothetical protein AFUB_036730 [Aspergillus fumigatus A1163]
MDQDVVAPWRELVVIMEESLLFDYAGKNNPSMAEEEVVVVGSGLIVVVEARRKQENGEWDG